MPSVTGFRAECLLAGFLDAGFGIFDADFDTWALYDRRLLYRSMHFMFEGSRADIPVQSLRADSLMRIHSSLILHRHLGF